MLEIFSKRDGNALKYNNLHDAYDIARRTESEVVYALLLEELYESRIKFQEFTLENSLGSNGNAIEVVFDNNKRGQFISNDSQSAVSQSNYRYDSKVNPVIMYNDIIH